MKRIDVSKEWLEEHYVNQLLGYEKCASLLGCSANVVKRNLLRCGIKTRPPDRPLPSKEWLQKKYLEERLSTAQIAAITGRTKCAIRRNLVKYGIPRRSTSDAVRIRLEDPEFLIKCIDRHDEYLADPNNYDRFIENSRKARSTSEYKERMHEIITRSWQDPVVRAKRTGPNHPNWRGGQEREYCEKFNNHLKESVRDAFGRTCVRCGMHENGHALCCHHITFDKQSGCFGKRWNLVPLCQSCHAWTNHNRWESYNLLMNWWSLLSDINLDRFQFCNLTFNANYNGLKF